MTYQQGEKLNRMSLALFNKTGNLNVKNKNIQVESFQKEVTFNIRRFEIFFILFESFVVTILFTSSISLKVVENCT